VQTKRTTLVIVLALFLIGVYATILRKNTNEKRDRSLEIKDEVAVADNVLVSITVIRVDPTARQLTARIRLQLRGDIAQDALAPKTDLRFVVNNSPGQQVFKFPKGEALSRIEATLPMEGDLNRYPFDRYDTNIWLLADTPDKSPQAVVVPTAKPPALAAPSASTAPQEHQTAPADLEVGEIPPAEVLTQNNRSIPISISLLASTPGMRYAGEVIRSKDISATRIHLSLRRPSNLVNVSITVMILMIGIAITVVTMVLRAIVSKAEKLDVLPLSMSVGLIFSLPALRNIQPGVPPVGVLGDYFSFLWAEVFVAAAAMIMGLTWVFRHE
jgi:hypothetical protein